MAADPLGASDRHFREAMPDFPSEGKDTFLSTDKGSCISSKENSLKFQTIPAEFFSVWGTRAGEMQLHHWKPTARYSVSQMTSSAGNARIPGTLLQLRTGSLGAAPGFVLEWEMLPRSPALPTGAAPGSAPNWRTGGTSRSLFPARDWKAELIWQAEAGEGENAWVLMCAFHPGFHPQRQRALPFVFQK